VREIEKQMRVYSTGENAVVVDALHERMLRMAGRRTAVAHREELIGAVLGLQQLAHALASERDSREVTHTHIKTPTHARI
jgi:hypothetical protein